MCLTATPPSKTTFVTRPHSQLASTKTATFSANEIREIFTSISRRALILLSGEQDGIGQIEFKIVGHRGVMRADMADILENDIDVDVAQDMLSIIFTLSDSLTQGQASEVVPVFVSDGDQGDHRSDPIYQTLKLSPKVKTCYHMWYPGFCEHIAEEMTSEQRKGYFARIPIATSEKVDHAPPAYSS